MSGARGAPTQRPGARRGPRLPGAGAWVTAAVVGVLAGVVAFPEAVGFEDTTPFVQVVAFRPQIAVGLLVAALLVAAGARASGPTAWPLAAALALVGLVGVLTVAPRATGTTATGASGTTETGASGRTLDVLTLNAYLGRADPDAVADLVRDRGPDLVALPEAGGDLRRRLTQRLDDDAGGTGYRSFVADRQGDDSPMTVFVRRNLGRPEVSTDRSGTFPSIVVDLPRAAGGLRFVAVHPQSPKPGDTEAWRRDVTDLDRWCTAGRPTVVAGDLNATADHATFRDATADCTDAAAATGDGLTGTWPSWLPRFLGAHIDHVLVTGGPRAVSTEVIDVPGTDHRAVLSRITTG